MSAAEEATKATTQEGGILDQLKTQEFWLNLLKELFQQAVKTFFMTLGGVLYWYGVEKFAQSKGPPPGAPNSNQQPNDIGRKAFGGGFSPAPSYGRETDFRPANYPTNPGTDGRFPGFGG